MRPTFLGFETAKRGLTVAQKGFDITGNNITNIHTPGYTRQRVDVVSMNVATNSSRYAQSRTQLAGQGSNIVGISQTRDAFLDKRFREEYSEVGYFAQTSSILNDIESVLDEITSPGLKSAMQQIKTQLGNFSDNPGSITNANIVMTAFKNITQVLNQFDDKLTDVYEQQKYNLGVAVDTVNNYFEKLASLNRSVRDDLLASVKVGNEYYGPNETLDERNLLLDKLAEYGNINVETMSDGMIKVTMNGHVVVDGVKFGAIDYMQNNDDTVSIRWQDNGQEVKLESGSLKGFIDMLNGRGYNAQSKYENTELGLPYYRDRIDAFANTLARVFNNIVPNTDDEGNIIKSGPGVGYKTLLQSTTKVLNSDGTYDTITTKPITAANISVSDIWANNPGYIIVNDTKLSMDSVNISGGSIQPSAFNRDNFKFTTTGTSYQVRVDTGNGSPFDISIPIPAGTYTWQQAVNTVNNGIDTWFASFGVQFTGTPGQPATPSLAGSTINNLTYPTVNGKNLASILGMNTVPAGAVPVPDKHDFYVGGGNFALTVDGTPVSCILPDKEGGYSWNEAMDAIQKGIQESLNNVGGGVTYTVTAGTDGFSIASSGGGPVTVSMGTAAGNDLGAVLGFSAGANGAVNADQTPQWAKLGVPSGQFAAEVTRTNAAGKQETMTIVVDLPQKADKTPYLWGEAVTGINDQITSYLDGLKENVKLDASTGMMKNADGYTYTYSNPDIANDFAKLMGVLEGTPSTDAFSYTGPGKFTINVNGQNTAIDIPAGTYTWEDLVGDPNNPASVGLLNQELQRVFNGRIKISPTGVLQVTDGSKVTFNGGANDLSTLMGFKKGASNQLTNALSKDDVDRLLMGGASTDKVVIGGVSYDLTGVTNGEELAAKINQTTSSQVKAVYDAKTGGIKFEPKEVVGNVNTYILKMIEAFADNSINFKGPNEYGDGEFKGTFADYVDTYNGTYGTQINFNVDRLEYTTSICEDLEDRRDDVSGISPDEEGTNLMLYQKSLQACSRLMTTLDEALDVIINKTGLVGR